MNTMKAKKSAASFFGLNFTSMEQLKIYYEERVPGLYSGGPILTLFNPAELKFNHDVQWKSTPIASQVAGGYYRLEFQQVQPVTLNLDLFFDTYEGDPNAGFSLGNWLSATVLPSFLTNTPSAAEVLKYTWEVQRLAQVTTELHRPPRCQLIWGSYCILEGVLTKLSEDYVYFLEDGTPVRAAISCSFQEYVPYSDAATGFELRSPDVYRRYTVSRGDTLSTIAQSFFNNANHWREIARANNIHDPRGIRPGQVLLIPKLK